MACNKLVVNQPFSYPTKHLNRALQRQTNRTDEAYYGICELSGSASAYKSRWYIPCIPSSNRFRGSGIIIKHVIIRRLLRQSMKIRRQQWFHLYLASHHLPLPEGYSGTGMPAYIQLYSWACSLVVVPVASLALVVRVASVVPVASFALVVPVASFALVAWAATTTM